VDFLGRGTRIDVASVRILVLLAENFLPADPNVLDFEYGKNKPLEHHEPLDFARSVMDRIIAKHDPKASKKEGNRQKVASGINVARKAGMFARNLSSKRQKEMAQKAAKARWDSE